MIITAYKSEFTGEIFENEADYKKHIRVEKAAAKKAAEKQSKIDGFEQWLASEKAAITNHKMIQPWLMDNQRMLMDYFNVFNHRNSWDGCFYDTDKFTEFNVSLTFSKLVSNTHNCPADGVTNWWSSNDLPRGYPGFKGQISGKLIREKKHNHNYPYGKLLQLIKIHTASGGGGNESWNYGVEIFISEWPSLEQEVIEMEQDQIIRRLKGVR